MRSAQRCISGYACGTPDLARARGGCATFTASRAAAAASRPLCRDGDTFPLPEPDCARAVGPARRAAPGATLPLAPGAPSRLAALSALERRCSPCPWVKLAHFFDYASAFSERKQVFSSGPQLHQSGIKIVHNSLFVSGLQVLIIFSIFPALSCIPATLYFWFMLLASSSSRSFSPDLPPTVTAAPSSPLRAPPRSPARVCAAGASHLSLLHGVCSNGLSYFNPDI